MAKATAKAKTKAKTKAKVTAKTRTKSGVRTKVKRKTRAAAAAKTAVQALPKMEVLGVVTGFFAQPSAAIFKVKQAFALGEQIYIKGHTTDFKQVVESMQIDRAPIGAAKKGQVIGLQVRQRVRPHDVIYRLP